MSTFDSHSTGAARSGSEPPQPPIQPAPLQAARAAAPPGPPPPPGPIPVGRAVPSPRPAQVRPAHHGSQPQAHPAGSTTGARWAGTPPAPASAANRAGNGRADQPSPARPVPVAARPIPVAAADGELLPEEEPETKHRDPAARILHAAPPWLVSLLLHTAVLIILGLIYLPSMLNKQVQLEVYAEKVGVQLDDESFEMPSLEPLDVSDPMLSEDLLAVDDPLAAPPDVPITIDAVDASSQVEAPSIGMALTGREQGMKEALLAAYGGTASTEAAVKLGLEWLQRNQRRDGSWSLSGPYSDGGIVDNPVAATSMALLAFQGAGHTHQSGEYQAEVDKAWKQMLRWQDRDGNFYHQGPEHHRLYSQAQAMIAVCELYGMTKDSRFRDPAQLAIDYAVRTQSREGGWRYSPGVDSDTSVTGWFVMGLQSGLMAGLKVPKETLYRVEQYLDDVTPDGIRYRYKRDHRPTLAMTAEALLCRQYLGWDRNDSRLLQGVDLLNKSPVDYTDMDVYYWYYATQVTHHMEGSFWEDWNRVMRDAVPKQQVKQGRERGSWNPRGDAWGSQAGRLYTTCLSLYMLEVYYRHLPIYKYRLAGNENAEKAVEAKDAEG